jgi:hypothetical protein
MSKTVHSQVEEQKQVTMFKQNSGALFQKKQLNSAVPVQCQGKPIHQLERKVNYTTKNDSTYKQTQESGNTGSKHKTRYDIVQDSDDNRSDEVVSSKSAEQMLEESK